MLETVLITITYVALCFAVIPIIARSRGRDVQSWVIISLLITPIWAVILLYLFGPFPKIPPLETADHSARKSELKSQLSDMQNRGN